MEMIASEPIIFQCLRYQDKEKKVGVLFKNSLMYHRHPTFMAWGDSFMNMYVVERVTTTTTTPTRKTTITTTKTPFGLKNLQCRFLQC